MKLRHYVIRNTYTYTKHFRDYDNSLFRPEYHKKSNTQDCFGTYERKIASALSLCV